MAEQKQWRDSFWGLCHHKMRLAPLQSRTSNKHVQKNNVIIIIIINSWHKTHIWIAEIKLPKSPIMPRNSTLLKFFTTNSSATFEIPYMMAPHNTRTSPMAWFLPVKEQYHKENYQLKKISLCNHLHLGSWYNLESK